MPNGRIFKRHELAAVSTIKEFIAQNPLDNKTTPELAEMVSIDRNVLVKGFRKLYGTGIRLMGEQLRPLTVLVHPPLQPARRMCCTQV